MTDDLVSALVQERVAQGLTQATIAARMGIGQSTVSQFETDDHSPSLSTVHRYAQAIGARVEWRVIPPNPNEDRDA